jgi:ribosomal RNA-processing protein 12
MEAAAVQLLPTLFKLVTTQSSNYIKDDSAMEIDRTNTVLSANQAQSIAVAISAIANFSPKQFLQNLFKKLITRLMEEMQAESTDGEKICSLLSLSQALVAASVLDEVDISLLYRALKPLIRDDQHGARVQKRAYKVLAEICEKNHSFVAELSVLKELTNLLTSTIMTSQTAARYMRLKCMGIIVDGFDEAGAEPVVSLRPNFCILISSTACQHLF